MNLQALLAAPADTWNGQGEDMALAFANRSALFMRQGRLRQCMEDNTIALSSGYPKHLSYKMYQRLAKCASQVGMMKDAKKYYEDVLASFEFSKMNKEQKKILLPEVSFEISLLEKKDQSQDEDSKTLNVTK